MKKQQQTCEPLMRPGFVATVGSLSLILVALITFAALRSTKHRQSPGGVVTADAVVHGLEATTEPETPPAAPNPGPKEGMRPEITLLQGLPKVQVTRLANSPLSDLKVSFKLDPRLTQSLYMGDRWLAPPTYLQVGKGDTCTVEASIRGLNEQGKAVNTAATWQVDDPGMVEMSLPGPGNMVQLRVVRPGQTIVEVSSQGITKRLPLHATSYGGTIMVALAQQ